MKVAKQCWFSMKVRSWEELHEVLAQPHNCEPFCVDRRKVRFVIR